MAKTQPSYTREFKIVSQLWRDPLPDQLIFATKPLSIDKKTLAESNLQKISSIAFTSVISQLK
jgi:hypothetical protein